MKAGARERRRDGGIKAEAAGQKQRERKRDNRRKTR